MTDLLDMACELVEEAREKISGMSLEEKEKIGRIALELVGDYPLYGSTSNITDEEAILIALVTEGSDFISQDFGGEKE